MKSEIVKMRENSLKVWIVSMLFLFPVTIRAQIMVSTTPATCDAAHDGAANVTVMGGTSPYLINGMLKEGGMTITGLSPGSYTVTVVDANGCSGSKDYYIGAKNDLRLYISGDGYSGTYCIENGPPSLTLTASASGGKGGYQYTWPGGSLTVHSSGEYGCSVTDAAGCTAGASAHVEFIPVQCSKDPNQIAGPNGYADPKWVSVNDKLAYTVDFENDPEFATAAAQEVIIRVPMHDKINMYSLRVGEFGFGDFIFPIPPNTAAYSKRLDLISTMGVYVDIIAGLDVNAEEAFWIFQTIDPATGLPPNDPLMGFLPVNDTLLHNGEGFVTFTMNPKISDITGDSVQAYASIKFDINDPLLTNTWSNVVDAVPPISSVSELPSVIDTTAFLVSFSGQDDQGGSGVKKFKLYYSKDSGPYYLFGEYFPGTSALFTGSSYSTYGFFSLGVDNVGNIEPMKTLPDATITLGSNIKTLNLTAFLQGLYDGGSVMRQAYDETGPHFGPGIADQVIVELHDPSNYANIVYTSSPVNLKTNGSITVVGIPAIYSGNYYITIRHRNSIETTTANPISLGGNTIYYNFSSAASKAYGNNMGNKSGVFYIYGADANQDGIVDAGDMNLIENAATAITFGYVAEDLNGDGIVDASDMNLLDNNATAIIMAIVP